LHARGLQAGAESFPVKPVEAAPKLRLDPRPELGLGERDRDLVALPDVSHVDSLFDVRRADISPAFLKHLASPGFHFGQARDDRRPVNSAKPAQMGPGEL